MRPKNVVTARVCCLMRVTAVVTLFAAGVLQGEPKSDGRGAVKTPRKVFILAGQSNMAGHGNRAHDLPAELKTQSSVLLQRSDGWQPLSPGKSFGPEVTFGRDMAKALGAPVGIIKLAKPGTSLAEDWAVDGTQTLYHRLLKTVAVARAASPDIEIVGVCWLQGEYDSRFPDMARDYARNLGRSIAALRRDLQLPELVFLCGRVNPQYARVPPAGAPKRRNNDRYAHVNTVRLAQEELQAENYGVVDLDAVPKRKDDVHYTAAGQLSVGEIFAAAMQRLLRGERVRIDAPAGGTRGTPQNTERSTKP